MKNMFLILTIFLFATGCSRDEAKQQENSIYGTWQYVEYYDGATTKEVVTISNDEIIRIKLDDKAKLGGLTEVNVKFRAFNVCSTNNKELEGKYFLDTLDNQKAIFFDFDCPTLEQNKIEFYYEFENSLLVLSPTARTSTCWEGCSFKFKKI